MSPKSSKDLHQNTTFEIECENRWQVYRRLKELDISCSCKAYQPLKVQVGTAVGLVQLWSVVRQTKVPYVEQRKWLEQCWTLKMP